MRHKLNTQSPPDLVHLYLQSLLYIVKVCEQNLYIHKNFPYKMPIATNESVQKILIQCQIYPYNHT